ncbi:MAG: imidazoleglycerol-phosphate dehydratase HisB [Planctomycetota bacterium]|nr:imidazoleglycerol-phosphate dehydratase HisB [Planctomycetota bacterium]
MVAGRRARVGRKTAETEVSLEILLEGSGKADVKTSVGFLTHMLETFARHSRADLKVSCRGDTHVDAHHLVEDVGIVLGQAFAEALGDKRGIRRFGFASVPMDEALVRATVDLSGRPFYASRGEVPRGKVGEFDLDLVEDFLAAFAGACRCNLHVEVVSGRSGHHVAEAAFKALARALREASETDPRAEGEVPSTKGTLR